MKEELKEAYNEAFSLRETPEEMQQIGAIEREDKIIYLYKDNNGKYWYTNKYRMADGRKISETEKVFGKIPESIRRIERRRKHEI